MNPMGFYQDDDYYLNYGNINYTNMSGGWNAAFIILILAILLLAFKNNLLKSGSNNNTDPKINNGVVEYWYSDATEPTTHSSVPANNRPFTRRAEVTDKDRINTGNKNSKKAKSSFNAFFLWI